MFEQVGEAVRSLVPPAVGAVQFRAHRGGVKVWLDTENPPRHHYEAQLLARRHFDGGAGAVLEIGFHAEHGDVAVNDASVAAITAGESAWRSELGEEPSAAPFLGRPDDWRRVSEVWTDADLDDPEMVFEIASRLADYVVHFQPLLPPDAP